jgi:hypothetical protein
LAIKALGKRISPARDRVNGPITTQFLRNSPRKLNGLNKTLVVVIAGMSIPFLYLESQIRNLSHPGTVSFAAK